MKAYVAVANSIHTAICHMLTNNEPYQELGPDYFTSRRPARTINRAIQQIKDRGYNVTITMAPVTAAG